MELALPVECNSVQQHEAIAVMELWLVAQHKKFILKKTYRSITL